MAEIVARLATGEPMAVICRSDGFPDRSTVHRWGDDDAEFAQHIARAREDGFDAIANRTRATARGMAADRDGDSTGDVQRDKLIIETDLKLLAKWDPKRYGDKLQAELTGKDGGPIQQVTEVVRRIVGD